MSLIDSFINNMKSENSGLPSETPRQLAIKKIIDQNQTVEMATSLNLASQYLISLANLEGVHPEMKGLLFECSDNLKGCSGDLMMQLQMIASGDVAAAVADRLEVQVLLYKVATVLNSLADGCEDESFVKLAFEVNGITNLIYDNLVELANCDETVRNYIEGRFGKQEPK